MSPPLEAVGFADFGAVHIEQAAEVQAPRPYESDGFDRVLGAMHRVYMQTDDERLALAHGLAQLREELSPVIRGPRGEGRPASRKARRRVIAALDRFIAEGKRDG